ncbi:hypothetical protein D3C87_1673130 [compost metagenome]
MVLGDVAAGLWVQQLDTEFQAPWQHGDFQRRHLQHAEFGGDAQSSLLRHQQHFAVGIEEHPLHGTIGEVVVEADAGRFFSSAIGRHAHQAIDEIRRFSGNLQRVPAQAIGGHFTQWAAGQLPIEFDEGRVIG